MIKLNWADAIDYATFKNKYIPSKEQAKKLGLVDCWSSTTDKDNIYNAYVGGISVNKSELHNVVLVNELETNQTISYRIGDI